MIYNILLYGNCQLEELGNIIIPSKYYKIYNLKCWETNISKIEMLNLIKNMDLIIMHCIEDNYRNIHYLSSTYIINNSNASTKFLFLTNLYLPYYYFDSYFDANSINCYQYNELKNYKSNKTKIKFINEVLYNEDFKSIEDLKKIEDYSFDQLEKRLKIIELYKKTYTNKNIEIINLIPFIKENFKKELLFYSLNHPTEFLFHKLCEMVNNKIGNILKFNFEKKVFQFSKGILYACLQKVLEFDILKCNICINKETNIISFINNYFLE